MSKYTLITIMALCLNSFAQDRDEKISTGHSNVLESKITSVDSECETSRARILETITDFTRGDVYTVNTVFSFDKTIWEKVELFDIRKTKVDGEKNEEKINVKEIERDVTNRPSKYSRTLSHLNRNGNPRSSAEMIGLYTVMNLELGDECERARLKLIEQIDTDL